MSETEVVPSSAGNPGTYSRTFDYDVYGRRTAVIDGLGQRFETAYDPRGNVVRETQPGGFVTSFTYDGLDRPTQVARPEGITVDHSYTETADASERRYKDALNQETIYVYDGLGRMTSGTYPDATSESYAYDAAGNTTTVTQADGTVLAQTFDELHRLSDRTITPAVGLGGHTLESYGYDALDRLVSADQQGT
ncbi:MAG: hypothetical protein MI919_26250, partial [Holophagales bacterium]|nr:hypothetical protein [Holophagales bacterium]